MGRSAVRVIARFRPTDTFADNVIQVQDDGKTVHIHTARRGGTTEVVNNTVEDHSYKVDTVLRDVSQESVFDIAAADTVKSVIAGYNGTVMCYGQTGAGKTFTMMGGADYRTRGVIPRAIKMIFEEISAQPDKTFEVSVSFIEVYIERIRDLLDPSSTEDFAIQEDARGSIIIRGVQHKRCSQEAEVLAHLFEGNSNRAVADHSLNAQSSRSHCVFTMHITSRSRVESESAAVMSKLHLIDLAGSERLSKTASEGQIMKEAQFINKSLSFLEQVVMALGTSAKSHVPFRQSKLTNILKDSLGGNSKTTMIANIWPEARHLEETVSTLKFATRMMKVQTDAAVNVVLDPQTHIRQLQRQITELKSELQMQNQLMGKSHIVYEGEIGEDERFEMEKTVRAFCGGTLAEIPVRSLREVKEYFRVFKAFADAKEAEARAALPPSASSGDLRGQQQQQQPVPPPAATARRRQSGDGAGALDESAGRSLGVAAPSKRLREVLRSPAKGDNSTAAAAAGEAVGEAAADNNGSHQRLSQQANSVSRGRALANDGGGVPAELPDKNVAFADFKSSDGARLVSAVKEAQAALASKKQRAAALGHTLNELKSEIDSLGIQLEQRRLDRQARGEDEVVDDEEFELVRAAKAKRAEYRGLYDELGTAKAERDAQARTLEAAKQRLLTEFEAWYDTVFGGGAKQQARLQSGLRALRGMPPGAAGGAAAAGVDVDDDDALDEGERFEILELNRVMAEDPDSVAYYSAKKLMQTRHTMKRSQNIAQRK